ncbi:MAG: sigma-54-dependent Fis family transcriptional regulator [Deltaproteobacteria bacterium]|nr:sigma-54-dependent Fis family transcriptional regulator [Deltaproteobacteria bacterium]
MVHALLVDDNEDSLEALGALVAREGFSVDAVGTLGAARDALAQKSPDLVLLDLKLPDGDGLDLLEHLDREERPDVVLITGHATVDTAVKALREGITDYLIKPVDVERLRAVLRHVARSRGLREQVDELRGELRKLGRFGRFIGNSAAIQEVYDRITRVAPTDATVMITGESGTGKELVALTIHELSERRARPFRAVNCGAFATELLESELFGHEKGAFTGADRRRRGCFEQAASGTLFLDEISEMAPDSQVRLLRILETGELTRLGGEQVVRVNARVIAATNRPLEEARRKGKLRDDLYYRLNVFVVDVPPLRDRVDDIEILARHFLGELNSEQQDRKQFADDVLRAFDEYQWPGNVRELKNVVRSAFILADEQIGVDELPGEVCAGGAAAADSQSPLRPGMRIAEAERRLILATLEQCDGNRTRAAELLGISVKTLYNRLKAYDGDTG